MRIRAATSRDKEAVRRIHLRAFAGADDKQKIAALAVRLLHEKTNPQTASLLAESDDAAVGHIAFSPARLAANTDWLGYILAPLAVMPGWQKQGLGAQLIASGLEQVRQLGAAMVFVYGDPNYYSRFGFAPETRYVPPYELQYPFAWQAIVLDQESVAAKQAGQISCAPALRDPELW